MRPEDIINDIIIQCKMSSIHKFYFINKIRIYGLLMMTMGITIMGLIWFFVHLFFGK